MTRVGNGSQEQVGEALMRGSFAIALVVAIGVALAAFATPAAADSCSERAESCDNACFGRTGDDAPRCYSYCRNERRACLKTGQFRTNGGSYSGLDRH